MTTAPRPFRKPDGDRAELRVLRRCDRSWTSTLNLLRKVDLEVGNQSGKVSGSSCPMDATLKP
jgi:hypothetical protein